MFSDKRSRRSGDQSVHSDEQTEKHRVFVVGPNPEDERDWHELKQHQR